MISCSNDEKVRNSPSLMRFHPGRPARPALVSWLAVRYLSSLNSARRVELRMAEPTLDPLFFAFQQAVIGRYSLERELGRGGMGVVYLAREVRLDRPVAIKLLPPEYAARPELRDRFMREARTAARLSHPYIVPIHAVDEIDGFVFIVMAYVDGGTLAQRVASHGPLPPADASVLQRFGGIGPLLQRLDHQA